MPFNLSDFVSGAESVQKYQDLIEADQAKKDLARIASEPTTTTPTTTTDTRGLAQGILPGESGGMPTDQMSKMMAPIPGTQVPKEGLTGLGGMQQGISGVEPTTAPAGVQETPLKASISAAQTSAQELSAVQKQIQLNEKYADYFNKKGQPGLANEAITKNLELQKTQYDIQTKHLNNVKESNVLIGGQAGAYVDAADDPAREPIARAELIRQAQQLGVVPPQELLQMASMPASQLKAKMTQLRDGSLTAYQQAEETRKMLQAENAALKLDQQAKDKKLKETLDNARIASLREGNLRKSIAEKRAEGYSPETDPERFTADELAWFKTGAIPGVTRDAETGTTGVTPEVGKAETGGATSPLEKIQQGILGVESSGGKADTSKPGIQGAIGPGQITPDTFKKAKDLNLIPKSYDINNPKQNTEASKALVGYYYNKYDGNIDKVAAAYQGGEGAINKDGSINLTRKDANGVTIADYIKRVKDQAGITGDTTTTPTKSNIDNLYDKKQGGGLTKKEWDSINPTALNIGKEYQLPPTQMASATPEEKKVANSAYRVSQETEDVAKFVKEHPKAVGTLAAITKSVGGLTGNLQDNVASDKRYTGDVQVLGKKLFTLGLKDAAASAGGRMNVFLEKSFAKLYDQSLSPESLLRIIKARQDDTFNALSDTYGADRTKLDKSKYPLAFSDDVGTYLSSGKSDWEDGKPSPNFLAKGKGTKDDPIKLD
jgi:Transglycosylase SLT domain